MRYWVYINDKVDGPYDEDKLVTLDGFTPETLICSEEIEEGGSQEWVKASNIFEFDEAAKTMTRAPLTEEELNTVRGNGADVTATSPITQIPAAADASVTQILIEKIDNLTREIEGLKGKLDAALAAAHAPQVPAAAAEPARQNAEPVTEEALITNTASLVNHAEKLVAQASASAEQKPVDFLDEIEIGASKAESLSEKGGEEVVLRSALDSLYNAKPQPEEEKEATFQDLLSPLKAAAATASGAALAAGATSTGEEKKEQPVPEQRQEAEMPAQQQQPQPVTEAKREEIINEITAPAQQNDLILQAIEEAQKEEQPAKEEVPVQQPRPADLASVEAAPQNEVLSAPQAQQTGPQLELPSVQTPQSEPAAEPADKQPLDLTDQPQLSIVGEEAKDQPLPAQDVHPQQAQQPLPQAGVSDELTPMNPADEEEKEQKEVTETIKELVPGKTVEAQKEEGDGLISQADLAEAFTERTPAPEFPLPEEDNKTVPAEQEQPPAQTQEQSELPEGKGFYNPNDMTEVELKEGSTYLISDFIPPAQASGVSSANAVPKAYGAVPGSAEAAQAGAEDGPRVQVQPVGEAVEEIVPSKKADQADLTMSKVILENTIKTKRGATMDIKTVPMVEEPADSQRLDLTDSDLDINTQHDLKAADVKTGGNKVTKLVLGTAVSVVILALIYVMLAYLEILPAQFNFIKSAPAAEQSLVQDEQLNEMLPQDVNTAQQAAPNVQQPLPQLPGQYSQQPGQAGQAQPLQPGQPQNAQMMPLQPAADPLDPILSEVKNFRMVNGQTLQQVINARHPAAQSLIEWNITTAVEPDNYSVLVKVPPENPQSFKISYRFNYNTVTKTLDPTISDSKNLLDSLRAPQPAR